MIYDNSSTHNLKQITRKIKIIVESLLQLIPIKTCQNGAKSVKHYSFFFFKLNPPAFSQLSQMFKIRKCFFSYLDMRNMYDPFENDCLYGMAIK